MQQLLNYLLMLIPIIGLIAGLSLGITIPLFLAVSLYLIKDQIKIHWTKIRLEIVFFILLCISSLWSNKPLASFVSFFSVLSISMVIYILITNVDLLINKLQIEDTHLIIGLLGAILLFYIEFIGNGLITTLFKTTFQTKDNYDFYLYYLDRGCALVALFAWVVIASLIGNEKNIQAVLIYLLVLLTLGILSTLTFVGIITLITPYKIIEEARFLPISAKHRLFIWDYSIQKITQKPFIGWGHGASRNFADEDFIEYEGHRLSVFPTHPHNNIVQILLENGIVGLFIYLALLCKYLFCWNKVFLQYQSKRLRNIRSAGFACFWTCLIISMISFNMWQNWFLCSYLWVALMLYFVTKQVLPRIIHNDSLEKDLHDY